MKSLVIANWKMNPETEKEAKNLFDLIRSGIKDIKNVEVVICPPFVWLPILVGSSALTFGFGSQDCFWEESGAFTGEISPQMLKNLGCQYVILGHSERRIYSGETDEMVAKKIKAALESGLEPILCIGETAKQKKQNKTKDVLEQQLKESLNHLITQSFDRLIIAYEPIWAIGTGNPCKIKDAKEVLLFLREFLNKILGPEISKNIRIIYGGSINSQNAKDFVKKANFQGLLVGGASLNAQEFIKIVKNIDKA